MKIALVAPPLLPVPPLRYGGVERVVGVLADGLNARGHDVTLFAPGDSRVTCRLVPTVPSGLWNEGFHPGPAPHFARTTAMVLDAAADFELIHSHLDQYGFDLAESSPTPVVSTIHGRTDIDPIAGAIAGHADIRLVAISDSQRTFAPLGNWIATVHHGLDFSGVAAGEGRGGYLLFVGRLSHDKGIEETVELARRSGHRLLIAAKALDPREREIYENVIAPAVDEGVVDFLGEVDEAERDSLLGDALATVMLSRWPEPFGLVAIESLATGTPLIATRSGALPDIVIDGEDGYIVDDVAGGIAAVTRVGGLDRARIRARALKRFSAARMVDDYVAVYERVLQGGFHSEP
jgi:glycosyltransferase involved in cell wall biosynthesis